MTNAAINRLDWHPRSYRALRPKMNPNPWHYLPPKPLYVLSEDQDKIEKFNSKNQEHALNLNVIPVPFVGSKDAPVLLLGNIAGVGPHEEEGYKKRPAYADRMRNNLLHAPSPYPFFPLDPGPDTIPSHREWWTPKLECLCNQFGIAVSATPNRRLLALF